MEESKKAELEKIVTKLQSDVAQVEQILKVLCSDSGEAYKKLDAAGKAQYDLFLSYALNSLFWVYLRTKGQDIINHNIKSELGHIRDHMTRAKLLKERTLAPRLDTGAAKRFIRGGLWEPKEKDQSDDSAPPANKRKRTYDQ